VEHVLWIGGPPASGKTTIATRLARRHGLRLYSADTRTWVHRDRAIRAGDAAARKWESLTPVERWERSTPAEMLDMSLHGARGPMVLDDVRALPRSPLIIAEGSPVPAAAVTSGTIDRTRAVWLLPTAEFQRARLDAAGTIDGHARLYRDLRAVIEREARDNDVATLTIDGAMDVAEMTIAVERLFADPLSRGPRAETHTERQALLREMNDAAIEQIRGYHERPWAGGNPETIARAFVCECGRPSCEATVVVTVGEAATRRPFAPAHTPRADTTMEK
jgi:hypothetical protein